jgi:hypothetical protein
MYRLSTVDAWLVRAKLCRRRRPDLALLPLGLVLLCVAPAVTSTGWETRLNNGQPIVIDPATNRAVIMDGVGQGRPLWDGVHRLHDGTTITIRSGVAVPNSSFGRQPSLPAPSSDESAAPEGTSSPPSAPHAPDDLSLDGFTSGSPHEGHCDHLLLKTCGLNRTCGDADACQLAEQLRSMQRQSPDPRLGNTGWAEGRCREALQDDAVFPACSREPPLQAVACSALVHHLCANTHRCQRSELCRDASALLALEQSASERNAPGELVLVRQRCIDMLAEQAFFPPCR